MERLRIIPRLKVLQIHEVGPIQDLRLEFGPAMNILTDVGGGGTGKTTILDCAAAAVTGRYPGFTSAVRPQSRVVAEFGSNTCVFEGRQQAPIPGLRGLRDRRPPLSSGENAMISLRRMLEAVPACSLVLLDDGILGLMDLAKTDLAMKWLSDAPAQKLVVVGQALLGRLRGFPYRLFTLQLGDEKERWSHCACTDV